MNFKSDDQRKAAWANMMARIRSQGGRLKSYVSPARYIPAAGKALFHEAKGHAVHHISKFPAEAVAGHTAAIAAMGAESLLSSALDYQRKVAEGYLAGAASAAEERLRNRLAKRLISTKSLLAGVPHEVNPQLLKHITKRERLRAGFTAARLMKEHEELIRIMKKEGLLNTDIGHILAITALTNRAQQLHEEATKVERKQHRESQTTAREKPFTNR